MNQKQNDIRLFVQILFWILILLSIVAASRSVLGSVYIDAPDSLSEGDTLIINFGSDEPATYDLLKDGTYITNAPPYEWETGYDDAGIYTFTVVAYGNSTTNTSKVVEIKNKPLSIMSPMKDGYNTSSVTVDVTTNIPSDICYTISDGNTHTLNQESPTHYTGTLSFVDGIHTITIKCKRSSEISEIEKTFITDTSPPEIISSSPNNGASLTSSPIISVTTNEVSECLASHNNQSYTMSTNDHLTHTLSTSPDEGINNYIISCRDVYDNNVEKVISFTYNEPPSAEIEVLSDRDILRAGTYDVKLKTSEPVVNPSLSYSLQGGPTRPIALEKLSDTEWKGYLVIESSDGETAGSFSFRAQDLSGLVGTEITKGLLFLVDTITPGKAGPLSVDSSSNSIKLSWPWDGEDVDFEIYRSTSQDVEVSEPYDVVGENEFVDASVDGAANYYYKIAAVDNAGNRGPFSEVVSGSAIAVAEKEKSGAEREYILSQLSDRLDRAVFDIEASYDSLEHETDSNKLLFIKELNLLERLSEAKISLKALQRSIPSLGDASDALFSSQVDSINDRINKAYSLIPKRIDIKSSISFDQPLDTGVQSRLAPYFSDSPVYLSDVQKIMEGSSISTKVVVAEIINSDRSHNEYTIFLKDVSLPPHKGVIHLLEYIPKDVASKADDVSFKPTPKILEQDPVIQYDINPGSNTLSFSYLISKSIDLVSARSVRSVAFPEPVADSDSALTGNVTETRVLFPNRNWIYIIGAVIIAALMFLYFAIDSPQDSDSLMKLADAIVQKATPRIVMAPLPQYLRSRSISGYASGYAPGFSRSRASSGSSSSGVSESEHDNLDSISLDDLIKKGHEAIDNKRYSESRKYYVAALKQSDMITVYEDQKRLINQLYYKLLLYKRVGEALSSEDSDSLRRLIDNIKRISLKIPESDTPLVVGAKESYLFLIKKLNRLSLNDDSQNGSQNE